MIRLHPVSRVRIRRIGAVLMSLLLTSVLLVSTGYVLLELHHACTGEHCPICANISHCVATLQVEGNGAVLIAASRPGMAQTTSLLSISRGTRRMADSPVSRKVKLSD